MAKAQSFWRPPSGINSKEYRLYMQHPIPLHLPYPLESHTMGGFNQNLSDALSFNTTEWHRGQIRTKSKTARVAEQTSVDITLGFPEGALWTPALQMAQAGAGCETDFFAEYTCPADTCFEHFYVFPEATIDPPSFTSEFITRDDVEMIVQTTTLHITDMKLYLHIDGYLTSTFADSSVAVVHMAPEDCPGCSTCVNTVFVGGRDNTVALSEVPTIWRSTNRGGSFTAYDLNALAGVPLTYYVTDIKNVGNFVFATISDALSPGPGTAGGVVFSHDGGVTWSLDANITSAMHTAFVYNETPYVAGDGGELWRSDTFQAFCQIVHTGTTETILSSAVDEEDGVVYLGATAGDLVQFNGSAVTAITSHSTATAILALEVAAYRWIQLGSINGAFEESFDAGENWCVNTVAGTTDDITAITSDPYRTMVGTDAGNIYTRDLGTKFLFSLLDYLYGATFSTAVTAISWGEDQNVAMASFLGATDGSIITIKSCRPDFCADQAASACSGATC